jgi:hypothetical protein
LAVAVHSDLRAVKDRFGGLVKLNLTGYDLVTAHRLLGEHTRQQVEKILKNKLDTWESGRIRTLLGQARACLALLSEKADDDRVDGRIRAVVSEYLECMATWANGAGLNTFVHPALAEYEALGRIDLAMFLQNDYTGCQTGMYRVRDGSVILWHTEEDVEEAPGSGFDSLRIADFNVGDERHPIIMHAFIYPDLLPGPAFGWRSDGYVQAVDKLNIRDYSDLPRGMLANVLTWITLRMGPAIDERGIIEALQPYYDGYALNSIRLQEGSVQARKFEFAGNRVIMSQLSDQPDSFLFQVNIFSDRKHPYVAELEDIHPDWCKLYEQRVERAVHAMQKKDGDSDEEVKFFFNMMTNEVGDDNWAYANRDVKAYFIHRQSLREAETWLGDGPAMPDDKVEVIKTIID